MGFPHFYEEGPGSHEGAFFEPHMLADSSAAGWKKGGVPQSVLGGRAGKIALHKEGAAAILRFAAAPLCHLTNSSLSATSARVGREGIAPRRSTQMEAAAQPRRAHSGTALPFFK